MQIGTKEERGKARSLFVSLPSRSSRLKRMASLTRFKFLNLYFWQMGKNAIAFQLPLKRETQLVLIAGLTTLH
ncbi:hypothetical protein H6F61_13290 [Cyanobacteria bacterium FACHB-472]|nr:hypothetical protein [Cyanobacteria bacterium FACHB-472]